MLRAFLDSLENENHPLLGPTLWGLGKWGLWSSHPTSKLPAVVHLIATLFVVSQYVELWNIRADFDMALRNLSVTMLSSICVIKAGTFVFWEKTWKEVIEYVSRLERTQLAKNDKVTNSIIAEYKKYSNRVTYFYWTLVTATVWTVILAPLVSFWSSKEYRDSIRQGRVPYPEIMSSWVPFDRTKGLGYWISVLEHILICFYGGGVVAAYDSNAVVLMSFFSGQLKLLSVNCSRLFDEEENETEYEKLKRIGECHIHRKLLIKYAKVLNTLLSPVMFLYVVICSLMLCASAIQINTEGTTSMQKFWLAEYLMALIAQLFLYCWHSNEVFVISVKVDKGVYASAWWRQSVRVRRCILLLGGELCKSVIFTAGPFTKLNVSTFLAILKGSYSYYTLLSNKDD